MTVVVHSFVADSSLLDCCDLMMCFWRFELEFFPSRLPCGQPYKFRFEANPIWYSTIKFTKSHSAKCSLHKWAWLRRSIKVSSFECTNLTHFRLTTGRFRGNSCIVMFGLLVSSDSLLQHSRPAWLKLFVDHTHTHSMNNLRWQPALTPQIGVTSEKVTWLMENPRQQSRPAYRK